MQGVRKQDCLYVMYKVLSFAREWKWPTLGKFVIQYMPFLGFLSGCW